MRKPSSPASARKNKAERDTSPSRASDAVKSASTAPTDELYFTDRFVPYLINNIASLFNAQFKKDLKKLGISVMQWRTLAVLRGRPGLSLREICAHSSIDQPTLSRIIDQLVERGLIVRGSRLTDGRFLVLSLTDEGDALFERLWDLAWQHYQRGTRDLTPEETNTLIELLQKTQASLYSS
jgi:DNA-binding MarR family transcriptional regulator